MNLTTLALTRRAVAALCAAVLTASLLPALAGATELTAGADFASSRTGAALVATVSAVDDVKRCMETDASKGEHHDQESWASQAEEWEKGAAKHVRDGKHAEAARAYEYAACLRLMAAQLEKAAEDYDKAAEQWDKAGDDARAQEARKAAKTIRDSMK
jgi:hypothetical protein